MRNNSVGMTGANRRIGSAGLLDLPARRSYVFWLSAAFVLIAGTVLAVRNYVNHRPLDSTAARADTVSAATTGSSTDSGPLFQAAEAPVPPTSPRSPARFQRLCISLAIVAIASVVAGVSLAHLLNRSAIGFRTVAEAESRLPVPVLGVVPLF